MALVFFVGHPRQVMDAYPAGREAAQRAGRDLTEIHSVASLFVPYRRIRRLIRAGFDPYSTNLVRDYIVRRVPKLGIGVSRRHRAALITERIAASEHHRR